MKALRVVLWIGLFLLNNLDVFSQVKIMADSTYVIEMKDGNTYIGKIKILEENLLYEVSTNIGNLTIKKEDILTIKQIQKGEVREGEYWPPNPHSSRYFFSPSGYGLRKGEGYYQNAWVLFNQVSYGITDHFSMGVGVIPIFLLGVTEVLPVWITPKLNFPYKNGKGAFGVGSILFGALGESNSGVGILYGTNTFGTRDKQITLGVGFGYSTDGEFSNYPAINIGGLVRTGKKWAFVSENYLFTSESFKAGIISGGMRYMGTRMAIDFGGFLPITSEIDGIYVIPWLSISIPFGKKY